MVDETLTPLGELLERARGSTSKRAAARQAGISEGRWRQIVTGQQKAGGGIVVPANPRRETVIAMAQAVGADVDEALRRAGMEPRRPETAPAGDSRLPPSTPPASLGDHSAADEGAIDDEVTQAIRRAPLHERARRHLLDQYDMLRELSSLGGTDEHTAEVADLPRRRPGQIDKPAGLAARRGKPEKS